MLTVSERTLVDVGFETIRKNLVALSNSHKNKELFNILTPKYSIRELKKEYEFTNELLNSINRKDCLPNNNIPETKDWLSLLSIRGAKLNNKHFKELYDILILLEKLVKIFNSNKFCLWRDIIQNINLLNDEKKNIEQIFDNHFAFKSDASPELKKINTEIKKITTKVENSLNSIFQKCKKNNWLQDDKLHWQNGRTVLPIIATYKRKIKGVIHGESSTNQTSFIEPIEVINFNNQIYHHKIKKKKEENKILIELTSIFYGKVELVKSIIDIVNYYDKHLTIASFANKTNSTQPNITSNNNLLIHDGINPIISLTNKNVVPLNIKLEDHMIIITGPNAGGKTVVLKTVGLFCAMAYSGLFLPSKKVKIPQLNSILSDIGDRQSIQNDLSTFSAHIKNLSFIIKNANSKTLVLIDEIGTGTEPASGAAISIAILEEIMLSNCIMIGSTHLSQIKQWADKTKKVKNARMIFDQRNLKPTFELELGFPGSSYCFEVAKKMGVSQKIITKSKKLIDAKSLQVDQLVIDLERERAQTSTINKKLINKLNQTNTKVKNLNLKIKELDDYKLANKKLISEKTNEIIESTKEKLKLLLRDIHISKGNTVIVKKTKAKLKDLELKHQPVINKNYNLLNIEQLSIGLRVYIPNLRKHGIVETIYKHKKLLKVNCNGMRIQLPLAELTFQLTKKLTDNSNIVNNNIEPLDSNQIDLRGCRETEAIDKLEAFIDKTILSNINFIRIIHGIGNGILRKIIHRYLSELKYIEYNYAHPNGGGFGVTEVSIKN